MQEDRKATKEQQTPTGLYDKAQGKRAARHPGLWRHQDPNPNGVEYTGDGSSDMSGIQLTQGSIIEPLWGSESERTATQGGALRGLPWALSYNPVGVPEGRHC